MYPTIYDAIKDLFGFNIPALQVANTFGFFVAVGFLVANYVMTLELRRKEEEGILKSSVQKMRIGYPFPKSEYFINVLLGFVFGYKILPIFFDSSLLSKGPQEYIFSSAGNWLLGVALASFVFYLKFMEDKKQRLAEPGEKEVTVHPWQSMGQITLVAAVSGIIGAKVFHWLEYWEDFVAHPMENIVSPSGLTFFGGLICGGIGVIWYARKKGIDAKTMLDVGGPAMMLAYGIGRFGCHFSGDGDWGITNQNPKPSWMSFLPDWFWAYNYPNNVARECDPTGGSMPCNFDTTPFLQIPVYPTPLYEALTAIALFALLWFLRKKIKPAGVLFGIYMILAGTERFFIEKIRVNSTYDKFGIHATQAEIIAVVLFIGGILLIATSYNSYNKSRQNQATLE